MVTEPSGAGICEVSWTPSETVAVMSVLPLHRFVPGEGHRLVVQAEVRAEAGQPQLCVGVVLLRKDLVGHGVPHEVDVIAVGVVLAGVPATGAIARPRRARQDRGPGQRAREA